MSQPGSSASQAGPTLLDSSVLVAAMLPWHEHHTLAQEAILAARRRGEVVLASRTLVETYSVLTRLPAPHRLSPQDAARLLEINFRATSRVEQLAGEECWRFLIGLPETRIAGGAAYDAEIVAVGRKVKARAIVTLDRRGFERSAPPELQIVIPIP